MTKIANYGIYVELTGLTWEMVFNANFIHWHTLEQAAEFARTAGYPYIIWNDLIYSVLSYGIDVTPYSVDNLR